MINWISSGLKTSSHLEYITNSWNSIIKRQLNKDGQNFEQIFHKKTCNIQERSKTCFKILNIIRETQRRTRISYHYKISPSWMLVNFLLMNFHFRFNVEIRRIPGYFLKLFFYISPFSLLFSPINSRPQLLQNGFPYLSHRIQFEVWLYQT